MPHPDWNEVQLAQMRRCLTEARDVEHRDPRAATMLGGQATAHLFEVVGAAKLRPLRHPAHPAADLRRAA